VIDQGGLAIREPTYVGVGYIVLEVEAVVAAVALMVSGASMSWLLALGIAAGPLAGYILSRSVGLPGYTDDIGKWDEPLGILSLIVEGLLVVGCAVCLLLRAQRVPDFPPVRPANPVEVGKSTFQ
jgi:hypothetical protein